MTQIIFTTSSLLASFSGARTSEAEFLRSRLNQLSSSALLTADPEFQRLGSGGGTVNALHNSRLRTKSSSGAAHSGLMAWLMEKQRLVLHAGGESRRLPAYAAVGKAFIPMPRETRIEPKVPQPLLACHQLSRLQQALRSAGAKPRVMIASGDVCLDFDASMIANANADIVGVGMRVGAEVAQHFGVYFVPKSLGRNGTGHAHPISFFLQKPSPAEVRHFEVSYDFYVDTGIWMLSAEAVEFLFKRCGWSEKTQRFETKNGLPLPLDLYTEIGCALGTETKPPAALQKLGFGRLTAGVIPLDTARFYHLGSSRQLLESIEEMQRNAHSVERFFCIASPATQFTTTDHSSVWIEASQTSSHVRLGGHNLLTGLPREARLSHLSTLR